MITEAQIALVQSSFVHVLPIADTAGQLLYGRIFTLAPETRSLFDDDITPQVRRTMNAVRAAVDGLSDLERIAPFLVKLGARHFAYGVRTEHFDVGGAALLWTLEQGLGDLFTADVREAWTAAWGVIANAMVSGLEQAAAELEPAGAAAS